MKSSYPRNISIIATVFIILIIFLALVNLYISIQFRNEFINYDRDKIISIATLCTHYFDTSDNQSELFSLFKNLSSAFNLQHIVLSDTLGQRIYDSRMLPLELIRSTDRVDFSIYFKRMPEFGEVMQDGDTFIYLNPEPPFYLYTSLMSSYTVMYDKIFRWHIFYITISLLFTGFLGIFLIRNLFLPMRYVANLARDMGIEMKKEDFVSETFNEIFKKMKLKEETLVEFSSYIAHEFRNSIGTIIGLARLIEKGKKSASDIVRECRTMEDLITKLLEYSRPLKAVFMSVDLAQLINEALQKVSIPQRIEVSKKIETEMPQFLGDYELLLVAVTNLLKNGIEAIKDAKGLIDIEVGMHSDCVCISITDSGRGIDEQELNKIFSPFYSRKEEGMGLGLAYVKKIMDLHNGRIEVKSKKGQGTTFTLQLPIAV